MPLINECLADPRLVGTLTDAKQPQIEAIADIYGLLDECAAPAVGLTKLTKLVHRKKPELLPLFDANVRTLYRDRVPITRGRSDRDFALAWLGLAWLGFQRYRLISSGTRDSA